MQRIQVSSSRRSSRSPGFTLIELVIVMVLLSTLAALVIPKLGFLQQQSIPVSGAATAQDLMNNLETYKTTTGFYPLRFDSLLTSGASGGALIPQIWGMSGGTSQVFVATASFDADGFSGGSWGMAFGPATGNYVVMDQDATVNDVNSSFNTPRAFNYGTDNMVTISQATPQGQGIWQAAGFPSSSTTGFSYNPTTGPSGSYTAPASATGVTLVAVGVGPQCSAVGTTLSNPPLQAGQQPNFYGRYIAVFAVYGAGNAYPGKPAELKLVLDSFQMTNSNNLLLYKQATPVDQ